MKIPPLNLQLVYTDGKPTRAIIDVAALDALLECAEDIDDLEYLASMTAEDRKAITLEDYLASVRDDGVQAMEEGADGEDLADRHREAS